MRKIVRKWSIHVVDTHDMRIREFWLEDGPRLDVNEIINLSRELRDHDCVGPYTIASDNVRIQLHDLNMWTCNRLIEVFIRDLLGEDILAGAIAA